MGTTFSPRLSRHGSWLCWCLGLAILGFAAEPEPQEHVVRVGMSEVAKNSDDVTTTTTQTLLDLPPRYMWGWGPGLSGFCGSMSLQTAALFFGNYLSQERIRGSTGGVNSEHQILLDADTRYSCGERCTALRAARHFHLDAEEWRGERVRDEERGEDWLQGRPHSNLSRGQSHESESARFIRWVRDGIDQKTPVIMGVYMTTEDSEKYDHIVPVVGYEASGPGRTEAALHKRLSRTSGQEDPPQTGVSAIFFNDLFFNQTLRAALDPPVPVVAAVERYPPVAGLDPPVAGFIRPRQACRPPPGEHVSAYSYCLPHDRNYGLRVLGNLDRNNELVPARLQMIGANFEPDYSREDGLHEKPVQLQAEIVVGTSKDLSPGATYALLTYDASDAGPRGPAPPRAGRDFLRSYLAAGGEPEYFSVLEDGEAWRKPVTFWSNSTRFYRVVRMQEDREEVAIWA